MSNTGKVFQAAEAPRAMRGTPKADAWAAAQTERYKVVATDGDRQIIQEELQELALRKLGAEVRIAATELLAKPPELRRRVLAAFDANGDLKIPFKRV
ncbi:MAG: hypothetical protein KF788_08830 [Piscinibacter sp.]|nr:hypothetical protein [Piscinibacter sp.]